jgi:hypothetical protein
MDDEYFAAAGKKWLNEHVHQFKQMKQPGAI